MCNDDFLILLFIKACFSSLVRLEGTFFIEFKTLTILLLVILATDAGRSRRPFSASDIIFCLGIVFCETAKFEPNAKTLVSVSVSRCFKILITHLLSAFSVRFLLPVDDFNWINLSSLCSSNCLAVSWLQFHNIV